MVQQGVVYEEGGGVGVRGGGGVARVRGVVQLCLTLIPLTPLCLTLFFFLFFFVCMFHTIQHMTMQPTTLQPSSL